MDIRQGNTIQFISVFKDSSTTSARSWDDVDNLIIYAYTDLSYIVKFSYIPMSGYNKLTRINSTHMLGAITAAQSKFMCGELILELCIKDKGTYILDGGDSIIIPTDYIDGGLSDSTISAAIDGGISELSETEEVGINGTEVGITIIPSIIKAEV